MWKSKLSEEQREYYQDFATQARKEYQRQVIEYRATGSYTESSHCKPLEGTNIWVRLVQPCELEQEIMGYETVKFAPRPPELDAAYEERQLRSVVKRKLKLKNLLDEDGNPKQGVDFEKMVDQERQRRLKRKREEEEAKENEELSSPRHASAQHSDSGHQEEEAAAVNITDLQPMQAEDIDYESLMKPPEPPTLYNV